MATIKKSTPPEEADKILVQATEAYEKALWLDAVSFYNTADEQKMTALDWHRYAYALIKLTELKPWRDAFQKALELDPNDEKIQLNKRGFLGV